MRVMVAESGHYAGISYVGQEVAMCQRFAIDLSNGLGPARAVFGSAGGYVLRRISYVGIPTSDQERTLIFWTVAMGCIVITDCLVDDKRWIELTIQGAQTGPLLLTPDGQEDRIGTFLNRSFCCDDVEYAYEKLRARDGVDWPSLEKAVLAHLL